VIDHMISQGSKRRFHRRLKSVTQAYHDRLEARLPLLDPHLTRKAYRRLIERFFGFYVPLEAAWEAGCDPAMRTDLLQRRKAQWLLQDLFGLDATPQDIAALPICRHLPPLDSYPRILGALYVVEGATLGGQLVARHLQQSLGPDALHVSRFFQSYRAQVPAMWEALLENLEAAGVDGEQEAVIVESACRSFDAFERWLAGGPQSALSSDLAATSLDLVQEA